VEFKCVAFEESLQTVGEGDFVYLDPPYVPEKSNSFVSYTGTGFSEDEHINLFSIAKQMFAEGANVVMSNSNTDLVRDNFVGYDIEEICCKRAINCKNPDATTYEVIIKMVH
jgi:DNA adenine methylase